MRYSQRLEAAVLSISRIVVRNRREIVSSCMVAVEKPRASMICGSPVVQGPSFSEGDDRRRSCEISMADFFG